MTIWKNLKDAIAAMATGQTNITLGTPPAPSFYTASYAQTPAKGSINTYTRASGIKNNIQASIKTIRIGKKWSQRELAIASGYSQTTVHRVEKNQGSSTDALIQMIAALDMELTVTPQKS